MSTESFPLLTQGHPSIVRKDGWNIEGRAVERDGAELLPLQPRYIFLLSSPCLSHSPSRCPASAPFAAPPLEMERRRRRPESRPSCLVVGVVAYRTRRSDILLVVCIDLSMICFCMHAINETFYACDMFEPTWESSFIAEPCTTFYLPHSLLVARPSSVLLFHGRQALT